MKARPAYSWLLLDDLSDGLYGESEIRDGKDPR